MLSMKVCTEIKSRRLAGVYWRGQNFRCANSALRVCTCTLASPGWNLWRLYRRMQGKWCQDLRGYN